VPFIDREEEIEFFVDWFREAPQRILFVYGPKSSGKTTVIEYVIEKKLLKENKRKKKSKYWVKYLNLREALIASYGSFLDTFFVEVKEEESEKKGRIGINVIGFKAEVLERVKKKQENLFKVFIRKIKEIADGGARPILILDEIQKLRDVYIANGNSERELLKEFLNFCVRLTKETHLCHVVILTSNTVFIERIYNDAKMKFTSDFKKIGHLEKWKVAEWLGIEGLKDKEIELVWEYLGGCIPLILKMFSYYKRDVSLEKYLEEQKWFAYSEIVDYLSRGGFSKEEKSLFKKMCEKILKKGFFEINEANGEQFLPVIEKWAEKEILFYDPLELKVTGNSRIYEKGMELLLERHT
jgi:AAA+ ATPase superfamily predicted ATPase